LCASSHFFFFFCFACQRGLKERFAADQIPPQSFSSTLRKSHGKAETLSEQIYSRFKVSEKARITGKSRGLCVLSISSVVLASQVANYFITEIALIP
jgi:hypothetical protein